MKTKQLDFETILREEYAAELRDSSIIIEGAVDYLKAAGGAALTYFLSTPEGREKLAQILSAIPGLFNKTEEIADEAGNENLESQAEKVVGHDSAFNTAAEVIRGFNTGDVEKLVRMMKGGPKPQEVSQSDDVDIISLNPFLAGSSDSDVPMAESFVRSMPFGYMSPKELGVIIQESPEDLATIHRVLGSSFVPHILEAGIRSGHPLSEFVQAIPLLGRLAASGLGKRFTSLAGSKLGKKIGKLAGAAAVTTAGQKAVGAMLGGDEAKIVAVDPATGQPVDTAQAAAVAQQLQGQAEDEIATMQTQRAQDLYDALKGLGTDNRVVNNVFSRISTNKQQLRDLYAEYVAVLYAKDELEDGDLIDWLTDDGREDYANVVAAAVPDSDRVLQKVV